MHQLNIKVEVFKEDDLFVALCPSLNVSSFGESIDEAKKSLVEAVEIFIEECSEMGTLDGISRSRFFLSFWIAFQADEKSCFFDCLRDDRGCAAVPGRLGRHGRCPGFQTRVGLGYQALSRPCRHPFLPHFDTKLTSH